MNKRIFTLILAAVLAALTLCTAAFAEDQEIDTTAGYYYVYTENGKGLNVRKTPGGDVVGSLKYGSKIYCYYLDVGSGWALIDFAYDQQPYGYGTYACYVSTRYLRKSKPPARTSESQPAAARTTTTTRLSDINTEFKSAQKVTPYTVTVRPSRASGWVNMRWAPSTEAEIQATYKQNDKLLVISELKNWYQVEDPNTGRVGFIMKSFTVK